MMNSERVSCGSYHDWRIGSWRIPYNSWAIKLGFKLNLGHSCVVGPGESQCITPCM